MSEMLRGQTWGLSGWEGMLAWLSQSCGALDIADVLEIGPSGHFGYEDEEGNELTPCAQFQKLEDDFVMLRLSMQFMQVPLLSSYSTIGVATDAWHEGAIFDDCNAGLIVSADYRMLAEACVTWFRDRQGVELDELGCEHHRARSLRAER